MLLCPWTYSSLLPGTLCSGAHWTMRGVAGERWLIPTKWVILSTSAEVTNGEWAFTWDTAVFTFYCHLKKSIHLRFPNLLETDFSIVFLLNLNFWFSASGSAPFTPTLTSIIERRYVLQWSSCLQPRKPGRGAIAESHFPQHSQWGKVLHWWSDSVACPSWS